MNSVMTEMLETMKLQELKNDIIIRILKVYARENNIKCEISVENGEVVIKWL